MLEHQSRISKSRVQEEGWGREATGAGIESCSLTELSFEQEEWLASGARAESPRARCWRTLPGTRCRDVPCFFSPRSTWTDRSYKQSSFYKSTYCTYVCTTLLQTLILTIWKRLKIFFYLHNKLQNWARLLTNIWPLRNVGSSAMVGMWSCRT